MTVTTSTDTIRDAVRAALYQRVSDKDQSIERQNNENRETAARHGWQASEYADPGLSASRFASAKGGANRQGYRRLLADIGAGLIDVLVLWESSRGNRELEGWAGLLNACRRHGVLIHITQQDHTFSPAVARDWKSLAEDGIDSVYESEKLSMRIKSGKDAGTAAGRPQGSIAYGLRRIWDPEKRRHGWLRDEPHPDTGPVVARIIREVGKGTGYRQIALALDADGIPAPRGAGRWTATTISRMAGNPVYADRGLVTQAESVAARARLSDTKRLGERPRMQRFRYSRVITCGVCGGLARGANVRGNDRYACILGHASMSAAAVDEFIDGVATGYLATRAAELFTRGDDDLAARYRAEAAGHRQKIAEATGSYNRDAIGIGELEDIRAYRLPKAQAAEKRAADAQMPSALAGLPDDDRTVVARRWDALTLPARKAAVRVIMPGLVLRPGRGLPVQERVIPWPQA
jgi:DNA invertase Pin-like site-specific DNA recombinase